MIGFLLQSPIVVEVAKQPEATRDASLDAAVSVLLMPFVVLLALVLGGAIVGGAVILYKRRRDATAATETGHTTRLDIGT